MSSPLQFLQDTDIILASQSPRRHALLHDMGLRFTTLAIEVKEDYPASLAATEVATYLSRLKAMHYPHSIADNQLVVCADTTVVMGTQVLGKPQDKAEAENILAALSGRSHHVISGVSLRTSAGIYSFADKTEVHFAHLSHSDIQYYVEHAMPLDKAGAYGIQEWIGKIGISYIKGCFYNVMGFPTAAFYRVLQRMAKGDIAFDAI